jgi:hypothetical protein
LFGNAPAEVRKVLDRRIIAGKPRHPFVMREADCGDALLELPGERGLAGTEVAVDQVSCSHCYRSGPIPALVVN